MPATVTLDTLRTRVQSEADITVSASGTFIVTSELDAWINSAIRQLYDMLVEARGEDYYSTEVSASTVAGTALYTWATLGCTDFYRLVEVMLYDGSNSYWSLPQWQHQELDRLLSLEASASGTSIYDVRYKLGPDGITLRPTPQTAGWTIKVHYIPAPADLTAGSDTVDGVNGWEDWVVLAAAIRCKQKAEEDPTILLQAQQQIEARIRRLAGSRDQGRPARVQDVRRDDATPCTWRTLHDDWDW